VSHRGCWRGCLGQARGWPSLAERPGQPYLAAIGGIALHHARNYLLIAALAVIAALMGLAFKAILYKVEDLCDRIWQGRPEWARPAVGGLALGLLLLALLQMYGVGYPVMYKAFGDVAHHVFGAAAGNPALYAVVAMGAVFASAARAPLTSLASVVEMTGDFALTLPVMLAVAIAATVSRAASYGTIDTTKLLRRGTDIDRATPWRALSDLKVADAMRPFRPPLAVPAAPRADAGGNGAATAAPDWSALAGQATSQTDPQSVFATESLAQTPRQLEVYGHDGLPVLSPDGQQIQGWITAPAVLRAIARQITASQPATAQARAAADWDHADPSRLAQDPPTPLPGYQLVEITITSGSPAAERKLGDITWPHASTPVSVQHGRRLRPPSPEITLTAGDRVNLLTTAPGGAPPRLPAEGNRTQAASEVNGDHG
jgi:CIC family chloride channel protein